MSEVILFCAVPALLAFLSLTGAFLLRRTRTEEPRTARAVGSIVLGVTGTLFLIVALGTGACFGYFAIYPLHL